jgi:hypothetical protein
VTGLIMDIARRVFLHPAVAAVAVFAGKAVKFAGIKSAA